MRSQFLHGLFLVRMIVMACSNYYFSRLNKGAHSFFFYSILDVCTYVPMPIGLVCFFFHWRFASIVR